MMKRCLCYSFVCCLVLCLSCLRKAAQYPAPEKFTLPVTGHINDLLSLQPTAGAPVEVEEDLILFCRVSADDASGNFHEQLVLEDSTGGISILLNAGSLFRRFPSGSSVYLKIRGLYLGNNHGTPELGGAPVADNKGVLQVSVLPAAQIADIVFPAKDSLHLQPMIVSLAELQSNPAAFCNRLVQLRNVEWEDPFRDDRFGEATAAVNTVIRDCTGGRLLVRTSNYASFRSEPLPFGSGDLSGIFSRYDQEGQLLMRDLGDLRMGDRRCDGSPAQRPADISVAALREIYKGRDTSLPPLFLRGVVTSDQEHGNFGSGNLVVQQGGKGITLFFGTNASDLPDRGDSVCVYLGGATLTIYNGLLEVKNLNVSRVKVLGRQQEVTPLTLTIAELNSRFAELESVLVRIEYARVSSGGKYAGNKTLSDGSGTIILYTSSAASFANDPVPTISKTFQGIVTPYGTTKEIKIRNPAVDVY